MEIWKGSFRLQPSPKPPQVEEELYGAEFLDEEGGGFWSQLFGHIFFALVVGHAAKTWESPIPNVSPEIVFGAGALLAISLFSWIFARWKKPEEQPRLEIWRAPGFVEAPVSPPISLENREGVGDLVATAGLGVFLLTGFAISQWSNTLDGWIFPVLSLLALCFWLRFWFRLRFPPMEFNSQGIQLPFGRFMRWDEISRVEATFEPLKSGGEAVRSLSFWSHSGSRVFDSNLDSLEISKAQKAIALVREIMRTENETN